MNLPELAAQLGDALQRLGAQVSTAESCTGGGIAEAITRIAGSSAWFEAGYVTYSNRQKNKQLAVPEVLFATVGAVSREVVEAMVRGAQQQSLAHFAVAVSGVAGAMPGGAATGSTAAATTAGMHQRPSAAPCRDPCSQAIGVSPATSPDRCRVERVQRNKKASGEAGFFVAPGAWRPG